MPTDSNGLYSLPAGYLAVTGETILASQHNPPLEDIEAGLTARLMRSGVAPMTGVLRITDGAVGAPSLALSTATTWGLYKTATGLGLAVAAANVADFTPTALVLPAALTVAGNATISKTTTFKRGADVASAGALTLGDGNIFNITGTTSITSIATKGIGTLVWLRFAGILTLTYHATNLILASSANITTAAGDWAEFEEYGSGTWRMVNYLRATGTALVASLPRGYIDGCTLSNGTDATNDIDFAAGKCRDSTDAVDMTCAAMAGKQLDANWAPGAAAGMRNSAAGIANGTYHCYAVSKADGTQDYYAHTSTTVATVITALQAETGGASYLYARRIGSIVRAGAALQAFTQDPDGFFRIKTPLLDADTSALSTTATNFTLASIPTGISWRVQANVLATAGAARSIYLKNPSETDTAPSTSAAPLASIRVDSAGVAQIAQVVLVTNTSSQVTARSDGASTTLRMAPLGWWDNRGKNA